MRTDRCIGPTGDLQRDQLLVQRCAHAMQFLEFKACVSSASGKCSHSAANTSGRCQAGVVAASNLRK